MEKKFDIVVVGELNVDLIFNNIESTLEVGKEVFARNMILTLGSSSAIFANNVSVFGSRVAFVGKVGQDSYADLVMDTLTKSGVNTEHVIQMEGEKTGITVALSYGEDRAMVTYPGAMCHLKLEDVEEEVLVQSKHLHVSSIFLQEKILQDVHLLFAKAKALGLTTSLDPQWDPKERWNVDLEKLLPNVDVFLPNEAELMAMTQSGSIQDGIDKISKYCNHVVVKQGAKGSSLYSGEMQLDVAAHLNECMVDAIGAGDSFNAGFINAFVQKKPLHTCMKYGTISGAVNTTGLGGTGAFKDLPSIKKIAKQKFDFVYE